MPDTLIRVMRLMRDDGVLQLLQYRIIRADRVIRVMRDDGVLQLLQYRINRFNGVFRV